MTVGAEPCDLSGHQIADGLRTGDLSAADVVESALSRVRDVDDRLHAFLLVTEEQARAAAAGVDERLRRGEVVSSVAGVPLALKDVLTTRGIRTTAGSKILEPYTPPYDCTPWARLKESGAALIGKTNCDEFAMGSSNENSGYGPVSNPWDKERVPGGSSGGSAAAVAAGAAPWAIGTDTGGSIRQPAAFTGTAGIKPTYGRCSRFGIVAFASSLDQAGPIARTVRDAAILLRSMAGHDPKDTTSVDVPVPDFEAAVERGVKGMNIGIPKEYRREGMPAEIEALWAQGIEWVKAAGAAIMDISLPHTRYALPAYYIVAPAEASSNLARYDGVRYGLRVPGKDIADMYEKTRAAGFGNEVRRRIMIGTYVLSAGYYDAYYVRAQKIRTLIKRDFETAFGGGIDAILTPATPSAAFGLGEKGSADPVEMYLNDIFTVTVNMAGLPGIAVPAGISAEGLPLGLQVIGRAFDEETLFSVAHVIEQSAPRSAPPEKWWA